MTKTHLITHDLASEWFCDVLRQFVGRGKFVSAEKLSEDTAIPYRTIRSYLSENATPGLGYLLTLISYFPPDFTEKLLAPTGKGHVAELGDGTNCALTIHECASRMNAEIASYLVDDNTPGRIDHSEAHRLDKTVDEVASTIGKYRAARAQKKLQVVA